MTEQQWVLNKFAQGKTDKLTSTFLTRSLMSRFKLDSFEASEILVNMLLKDQVITFTYYSKRDTAYYLLGSGNIERIKHELSKMKTALLKPNICRNPSFSYGDKVRIINGKHAGKVGELDDLGSEGFGTAIVITEDDNVLVRESHLVAVEE